MRNTPLAVWFFTIIIKKTNCLFFLFFFRCSKLSRIKDIEFVINQEISLTHSNEIIKAAALCYCLAIRYLLNNDGDMEGAYNFINDFIYKKSETN